MDHLNLQRHKQQVMGVTFTHINSHKEFSLSEITAETSAQVFKLAEKVIQPIFQNNQDVRYSHFIVATTCPDTLAPSLGQALADHYNKELGECQIIDMVQGCAGGVNAMILASQLAAGSHLPILILTVDAAKKATSPKSKMHHIFGNGAFACVASNGHPTKRILHVKSKAFKGLSNVVKVNLGHDADQIIIQKKDIKADPRMHLGLSMNKVLALKLLRRAEDFFKQFVTESTLPDVLILHQVNTDMMSTLQKVFSKYDVEFVNVAWKTGNCGTATTGIALHMELNKLESKKVMVCSFGTGGVITAGMWQF